MVPVEEDDNGVWKFAFQAVSLNNSNLQPKPTCENASNTDISDTSVHVEEFDSDDIKI